MRLGWFIGAGAIMLVQFHPLTPKHYVPQPGGVAPYANPSALPTAGGDVNGPVPQNTIGALHGQAIASPTGSPGNVWGIDAAGRIGWTATPTFGPTAYPTPATPTAGPTPDLAPTPVAGLPSCVPGLLGRRGQVTDENCTSALWGATPLATAGAGCQVGVFCLGVPSGTPTPTWIIE
jgi:hypothetical protein